MSSYRIKRTRAHDFVTRSLQNINCSALDLAPISHYYSDRSERTGLQQRYWHQPTKQLENVIEDDSSAPFGKQNIFSDEFTHNGQNVIFTTGELQSHSNRTLGPHCGQYSNAHIQIRSLSSTISSPSSLLSSSEPQPPHWSTGGCSTITQSENEHHAAKDCVGKEQRKLTRRFFVTVFSICYAIFLIVFSAILFISDVVDSKYPRPQIYCIYMLLIALAYFLYLFADIRCHMYRTKNQFKDHIQRTQYIDEYMKTERAIINKGGGNQLKWSSGGGGNSNSNDGASFNWKASSSSEASYSQAMHALNLPSPATILHRYCFISGRNGSSLYVKLGASWFAFGLLVYSALRISYDIFFISSYGTQLFECASFLTLAINILFPLYALLTLLFIMKYMNVVINVNPNLARIFLYHAIGTSLSLWVFTIIHETADAIAEIDAVKHHSHGANKTFDFVYNDCGTSNALNSINRQFAPYLYPFVIEYCILVVAICCKVYEKIGHCTETHQSHEIADCKIEHRTIQTPLHIQADCDSSMNGIFYGLLFLIVTIVCIILVFVGFQNRSYLVMSIAIDRHYQASALFILIASTIIAYAQTTSLDIKAETTLQLDDILLLITIPVHFVEFIFSLVPAYKNKSTLQGCIAFLRIIDVLIQTTFIIDGQRRCMKRKWLHNKRPGRQIVIFLAIANMALWIHQTFSGRNVDAYDERFAFYGHRFWNILDHTCVPLTMFYRFHASVCLVDIWSHAFKPIERHR